MQDAVPVERAPLRLAWSNPNPPRPKPRRVDLAAAIARHLAGQDGLDQAEFLRLYSGAAGFGARRR